MLVHTQVVEAHLIGDGIGPILVQNPTTNVSKFWNVKEVRFMYTTGLCMVVMSTILIVS